MYEKFIIPILDELSKQNKKEINQIIEQINNVTSVTPVNSKNLDFSILREIDKILALNAYKGNFETHERLNFDIGSKKNAAFEKDLLSYLKSKSYICWLSFKQGEPKLKELYVEHSNSSVSYAKRHLDNFTEIKEPIYSRVKTFRPDAFIETESNTLYDDDFDHTFRANIREKDYDIYLKNFKCFTDKDSYESLLKTGIPEFHFFTYPMLCALVSAGYYTKENFAIDLNSGIDFPSSFAKAFLANRILSDEIILNSSQKDFEEYIDIISPFITNVSKNDELQKRLNDYLEKTLSQSNLNFFLGVEFEVQDFYRSQERNYTTLEKFSKAPKIKSLETDLFKIINNDVKDATELGVDVLSMNWDLFLNFFVKMPKSFYSDYLLKNVKIEDDMARENSICCHFNHILNWYTEHFKKFNFSEDFERNDIAKKIIVLDNFVLSPFKYMFDEREIKGISALYYALTKGTLEFSEYKTGIDLISTEEIKYICSSIGDDEQLKNRVLKNLFVNASCFENIPIPTNLQALVSQQVNSPFSIDNILSSKDSLSNDKTLSSDIKATLLFYCDDLNPQQKLLLPELFKIEKLTNEQIEHAKILFDLFTKFEKYPEPDIRAKYLYADITDSFLQNPYALSIFKILESNVPLSNKIESGIYKNKTLANTVLDEAIDYISEKEKEKYEINGLFDYAFKDTTPKESDVYQIFDLILKDNKIVPFEKNILKLLFTDVDNSIKRIAEYSKKSVYEREMDFIENPPKPKKSLFRRKNQEERDTRTILEITEDNINSINKISAKALFNIAEFCRASLENSNVDKTTDNYKEIIKTLKSISKIPEYFPNHISKTFIDKLQDKLIPLERETMNLIKDSNIII